MSRLALPAWNGRVSPVLDVARRFLIVDLDGRRPAGREVVHLSSGDPCSRLQGLGTHHVDVLICGAVSQQLERVLDAIGVTVVSGICGDVDHVLDAYLAGRLDEQPQMHLPGWHSAPALNRAAAGGGRGRPS